MSSWLTSPMLWWLAIAFAALVLAYLDVSWPGWTLTGLALLSGLSYYAQPGLAALVVAWTVFALGLAVFALPPVRRALISVPLLRVFRDTVPALDERERHAVESGSLWWEGELFRGRPRWRRLLRMPACRLPDEVRAFLDGSVNALCAQLDEYQINHELDDLPPAVWELLRGKGLLALRVPKEHGGKGFSSAAVSAVVSRIATRSPSAAITVAAANAPGLVTLLANYGTAEQRQRYLPALAGGSQLACFARSSVQAGSDLSGLVDRAVVERRDDGSTGLRLEFDKRYVTLGPVATLIGLTVKLEDPQQLLGEQPEPGLSIVILAADTPGVERGARHKPGHLGVQVGPLRGRGVRVSCDALIGGAAQAGRGWEMLVQSDAEAGGVVVPALCAATAKLAARCTGAYARIRFQFNTYLGQFEGVQEALASIAGNAYAIEAARVVTLGASDAGERPVLAGAMLRYRLAERCRSLTSLAMDVFAGAGLCLGPGNLLGEYQKLSPLIATIDGSGLYTRNVLVFGQGVLRAHPHLLAELDAACDSDMRRAERRFDRAVARHMGFVLSNLLRALLLGLTGARLAPAPLGVHRATRRYYRQIARMSAAFAMTTDWLLLSLRGSLRRNERLAARMADIVSELYIASTALKYFHDGRGGDTDLPLLDWVVQNCLLEVGRSFERLFENFPLPGLGRVVRRLVFPLGRPFRAPGDALERQVARMVLVPSSARDRLTAGMYLPGDPQGQVARLETALEQVVRTTPALRKLRDAANVHLVRGDTVLEQLESGLAAGVLSEDEAAALRAAEAARAAALQVDEFPGESRGASR